MLENTLNLIAPIHMALEAEGYTKLTPIQEMAIPKLLEGHDLLGVAQTGTGKTAAFAIPILQKLEVEKKESGDKRPVQSLIVAPTRELAIQIDDSFKKYAKNLNLRTLVVYGGVSQHPQTKKLRQGVDIIVATPGRLLDLVRQKHIDLKDLKHFVLDEADMMLDMGMLEDVKKIVKYIPKKRQTMLFSATMPKEIEILTKSLLNNPVKVEVTPTSSTVDRIKQEVYLVDQGNKTNLLVHLLNNQAIESALIFSRTKRGADKLVKALKGEGFKVQAIHGNKSQRQRQTALKNFKERKIHILVATDIAARGIDISDLSHVINYNLPEVPETYVHRIGRTGRSGNDGIAISFCSHQEKSLLRGIQRLTGKTITEITDHPFPLTDKSSSSKSKSSRNNNRGRNSSNRGKSGKSYVSSSRKNKKKSGQGSQGGQKKNNRKWRKIKKNNK
ncbi:MAG: DEAD/DEAH box helicase [Atopococcus tabaci]|uniref:ATP-dependent RNA helicase CshA n=1 Tax=Atopococcus tabaci TaxID=269774 RepID=A0AA43UD78_9LACT|nr:DEAD/DEAH box helicase [Atopococcus tabaci]